MGSYVEFNESLMAFAVHEPQLAGRIYAREFGHALGLDHKGAGSIMNTAAHGTQTCRQGAQQLVTSVWNEDAADAHDCERAAHANTPYGPPPSYFWQEWFPTCQTIWLREEYWVCPDGCFLDFIIDLMYSTNC